MGAWNASINGNDTAQDLKQEYTCAFFYYSDVEEAVRKIVEYAASQQIDESDPEEYCDYVYSLADFMWKKGILTDDVRDRALKMIDAGFGLEIWEESGEKMLQKRKAVLEGFRKQLTSPMGERKKIRPNVHMKEIFEDGDLIAVKLMTEGKSYSKDAMRIKEILPEQYSGYDGKYVLMQKIGTRVSWRSSIVPEVRDCWAVFKLFDGIYDEIPKGIRLDELKEAHIAGTHKITPYFVCESNMFYFKKRKCEVLGSFPLPDEVIGLNESIVRFQYEAKSIYWGIYNDYNDPDSDLIASMGNDITIRKYAGGFDVMSEIIGSAYVQIRDKADLSSEDANNNRDKEKQRLCRMAEEAFISGGEAYCIYFGDKLAGFIIIDGIEIKAIFVKWRYQRSGFAKLLIRHAISTTGRELHMKVPDWLSGKLIGAPHVAISIEDILNKICVATGVKLI